MNLQRFDCFRYRSNVFGWVQIVTIIMKSLLSSHVSATIFDMVKFGVFFYDNFFFIVQKNIK